MIVREVNFLLCWTRVILNKNIILKKALVDLKGKEYSEVEKIN